VADSRELGLMVKWQFVSQAARAIDVVPKT
jgi:hypothetical protein